MAKLLVLVVACIWVLLPPHLLAAACPEVCTCLGAIVDCSKAGIKEVPKDLPEWAEELDLGGNKGLRLTPNAFQGLPVLQTLYLRKLNLSSLPRLGHLPALTELFLSDNRISKVSAVSLEGLPRLLHLDLSRNRITRLSHTPFANVSLARLNLNRNLLTRLPPSAFRTLTSLAELKLSRNLLTPSAFNLSDPAFANLTNLRILDLSGNKLTDLRGLVFEHLKKLRILRLRRNGIQTFSDGALYGLDSIEKLYLDYNNLTTIRSGLLFGLKSLGHLSFKSNQIHSIRADTWQSTERLQSLDLSDNRMVVVREGTFRGLGRLTSLSLAHNHLAHIEQDAFKTTPSLIDLDLGHNGLRWSVEDNSGVFTSLTQLKSLSLAHNNIETIHVETLKPLVSLTSLDLMGNQLRTLPHNPFSGLIHLSSVALNTSSLVCDCHLSWLPSWLASITGNTSASSGKSSSTVECGYPPALQGRRVASLMGTEFSCESSPRPVISHSPDDRVALYGTNVTLACVAQAGEGGAQARFIWRKDNQLLVDFPVTTTEQAVEVEGQLLHNITSRLLLTNVSEADSGNYQCVVRNDFGASYSRRAHIQVHIYPYFTKRPASVAVRIGEAARLECAATGSPPPEISLLKDGGEDFPAARERRIFVHSNETLFFIKPVAPHDEGVYTCRATNVAGTASAHATLTIRQIPEFTKPPKDEVATLGHNAVLECRGTGLPIPKLTWTKNGETLTNDGHYLLVDDNQFLLIRETRLEDLGTYTCELTNVLGTSRERINLTLRDSSSSSSTTTGIVVIVVVCCVVVTSLVWVIIIHQTRRRTQAAANLTSPAAYPRDEGGLARYPAPPRHGLAAHHHLTSELMHNMTPLLGGVPDGYPGAQDSGSEHSSGKDSGTGDSAQRSNEDLLPLDLSRPGLRRSLIICGDSRGSPVMRGVGGAADPPLGCEEVVGRPVLSTFSPQHLSPGSYGPAPHYTASLRRGSNSRLLPVSSPVTPSSTLPRGPPLHYQHCSPYQSASGSPCSSEAHSRGSPPARRHSPDGGDGADEGRGCGLQRHRQPNSDLPSVHSGEGPAPTAAAATHSPRASVCSDGDGRSELDLRMDTPEVQFSDHTPPTRPMEVR
ncbi:leucine-rich repeats and immunoglobulin-like domains protein 2 [Eriocheir sinensis]|uniref:leucine-rich repeats and immunoglobulin-like domains protein 2 n=1 Tax=Eriocheir sinensis TaxID=95602 RepID=UPI0021C9F27A|nr:leucine-rich repeats and immunoglobulin-like domains protein 2 [Eriocheir sinensis]